MSFPVLVDSIGDSGLAKPCSGSHQEPSADHPQLHIADTTSRSPQSPTHHHTTRDTSRSRLLGVPEYHSPQHYKANARSYNYEEKYPEDPPGKEADNDARVWKVYLDEAEVYDEDMIRGFKDTVDSSLIFASLFSAVITTLVVESSSALQPDHMEIVSHLLVEQVQLLRANGNKTTIDEVPASIYGPNATTYSSIDIWVNALFFTSLTLLLTVALVSILLKQWRPVYTGHTFGTAKERALVRHHRFLGLEKWRVRDIVGALPLLLHFSLAIFGVGLVLFIRTRHVGISWIVFSIFIVVLFLYILALSLPAFFLECPYRIPLLQTPTQVTAWLIRLGRYQLRRITQLFQTTFHIQQNISLHTSFTRPELDFVPFRTVELQFVRSDISTRCGAVAWMSSVSSNPSVKLVAMHSLAGILPGPCESDDHGVNSGAMFSAWARHSPRKAGKIIDSLASLYPVAWKCAMESQWYEGCSAMSVISPSSRTYDSSYRAEVLVRSYVSRFGSPALLQGFELLRSQSLVDAIDTGEDLAVEKILQLAVQIDWSVFVRATACISSMAFSRGPHFNTCTGLFGNKMYATLLHHLAARGHTAALKCVLSGAPDVNTICSVGADTPLHRASSNGHLDSVRLLLASGADLTLRNLSQHTPAMAAILRNHAEVAIFLISNSKDSQLEDPCCNRNSTLLHAASKKGLLKVVQVLLWRDVHPNILDLDGRTPLVHACSRGHAEIIQVLLQQLHTKKLLYGSLDTPLYVAIENGHEDAVRLLLEAGAISQINSQRNKFEDLKRWAPMGKHVSKPLHLACSFGHTKIAQLLLEHGADTSIPDSSRQTQEDLVK